MHTKIYIRGVIRKYRDYKYICTKNKRISKKSRAIIQFRYSSQQLVEVIHFCCVCRFVVSNKLEQRVCNTFCVALSKSTTETFEMIEKASENEAMGRSEIFEWHKRFLGSREATYDDQPALVNLQVQKMWK